MDLSETKMLIVSVNPNDESAEPMMLSGEEIAEKAKVPSEIGKVLVDMAYAEGIVNGNRGIMAYEKNTKRPKRLARFETGYEDLMTGGWVRVLLDVEEGFRIENDTIVSDSIARGDAVHHGCHRGVHLVEFVR